MTQQVADRMVITVRGEMALYTCTDLAEAAAVIPLGGKTLHLDLSGVPFMDSSGLNLLIQLRRRLHAESGHLALSGLQSQPSRLLEITEAYDLFTVETAAAALP
ncbi:STAS domain-containing protein [Streptomyces collinus]|uniref:STAS domain-containing protein n=1 Tax=Streptomyces collinus TaxID=42684 RepID=UPI0029432261|nr:STAS domain-containing protein [Streptomyces collinus]